MSSEEFDKMWKRKKRLFVGNSTDSTEFSTFSRPESLWVFHNRHRFYDITERIVRCFRRKHTFPPVENRGTIV